MSTPHLAFKVSIQLGDDSVVENNIGAASIYGAVKFIQDEATKNGWFVKCLLVEPFTDADVVDGEVVPS